MLSRPHLPAFLAPAVLVVLLAAISLKRLHYALTAASKQCADSWNGDPSPLIDGSGGDPLGLTLEDLSLSVRGRLVSCFRVAPSVEQSTSALEHPVIFLHGFPDNRHTFKHQMITLASRGYISYSPALRGYDPKDENADRAEKDYSVLHLALDALGLADSLGLGAFHLVGHDWGSAIASIASKLEPDRVRSVTLMSVPNMPHNPIGLFLFHPDQVVRSWYMIFFQLPLLPELWLRGGGGIEALWRHWGVCFSSERLRDVEETIVPSGRKDVTAAALGYYRVNLPNSMLSDAPTALKRFLVDNLVKLHGLHSPAGTEAFVMEKWGISSINQLGDRKIQMPALLMVGEDDGCIGKDLFSTTTELGKAHFKLGYKLIVVKGAGHFLQHEQREKVSNELYDFFRETDLSQI